MTLDTALVEELRVHDWRFDQLLAAGYSECDALLIAEDTTIDLERARNLVAKLGCPPEIATRILA